MPCVINAHRATRPASKHLAIRRQTLKKQLNGIGACHTPDLMTDAYPSALVSARNGIPLNVVVKHGACTGQPLSVIRDGKV